MTQNKQNGFLSNLAEFIANELVKENQQVYEKAYFEALDNGTSQLRVKLNEQGDIEMQNVETNKPIPQFKVWDNTYKGWISNQNGLMIDNQNNVFRIWQETKRSPYELVKLEDITICRFTGLFDKNIQPLYYDNIVKDYQGRIMHICIKRPARPNIIGFRAISKTNFDFADNMSEWGINESGKIDMQSLILNVEILGTAQENPELGQSDE